MAMVTKTEVVTPEIAELWLNTYNTNNRKMREGVAEKYASDMRNGRWTECPDPIVFYEDGSLCSGQHRLWGIIDSGTTQTFNITRGISREAGLNIDTGVARTIVDNARISGTDPNLSNTLVSTARAIHFGASSGSQLSMAAKLELVNHYREAAQWAISALPHAKNIANAVILGAVGRAWYWQTTELELQRLKRFCDVIASGHGSGDADSAAVSMRNYMIKEAGLSTTSAMWTDTFYKAQNAIHYFMQGKKLMFIKSVKEEAYPLKRGKALKLKV